MNTVRFTYIQVECDASQVAAIIAALPFNGAFALASEPVLAEFGTTLTGEPSRAIEHAAAPAPREQESDPPPALRTRKPAAAVAQAEPEPRPARDSGDSIVDKVVAAFGKDNNSSLPKLAERLYGDSSGKNITRLKQILTYAVQRGRLKRIGANAYSRIED